MSNISDILAALSGSTTVVPPVVSVPAAKAAPKKEKKTVKAPTTTKTTAPAKFQNGRNARLLAPGELTADGRMRRYPEDRTDDALTEAWLPPATDMRMLARFKNANVSAMKLDTLLDAVFEIRAAGSGRRFSVFDARGDSPQVMILIEAAHQWVEKYTGENEYMYRLRIRVEGGAELTNRQVTQVLNRILIEA